MSGLYVVKKCETSRGKIINNNLEENDFCNNFNFPSFSPLLCRKAKGEKRAKFESLQKSCTSNSLSKKNLFVNFIKKGSDMTT